MTFEIDAVLVHWAARTLRDQPNVTLVHADAEASAPLRGRARKIIATFAVESIPPAWTEALPEGGRLVTPVGVPDDQRLVLVRREQGHVLRTDHGAVRYVTNRLGR